MVQSVGENQVVLEGTYNDAVIQAEVLLNSKNDFIFVEITKLGKNVMSAKKVAKVSANGVVKYAQGGMISEEEIMDKIQYYRNGIPPKGHKYALRFKGKVYSSNDTDEIVEKVMKDLSENKMADGGRVKVGVFDENQLKNKEDKKAVEKAQKETGLSYVDSKIIKKGGKMFLEVYLIPNEEYYNSNKFAKGGKTSEEYAVSGILSENNKIEIISKHKSFASALVKMNKMYDEGKLEKYREVRVKPISKSMEYAKGGTTKRIKRKGC
jgi:hypothetical protein